MTALGGLLCVLFIVQCYGTPTPPVYDTIVVGLGASGAAAAGALAAAGRRVLALEAQARVGGRVHTVPFGDSIVEVGAEWIHGTENSSTYELAIKNNITILEQGGSVDVYFSDGSSPPDKEAIVKDVTRFAVDVMDEKPEEPESVGQYMTRRVRDYIKEKHPSIASDEEFIQSILEFLDPFVNTYESSNSWNDLTTKSDSEALGGSQDMSWHTYGYKTLFDLLLNTYNDGPGYPTLEIKLNSEVTQIRWPQDPAENVVVTVKDGSTFTAKKVIVTASLGVLKERYETLFSPPLPEEKVRPIKAISIGICAKIIFRFDEIWWSRNSFSMLIWRKEDKASVAGDDEWLLRVNTPGTPMANNKTITMWACGDTAKKVESLPKDVVQTKVMGLVRRFMGANKTIPDPVEVLISSWYSNPFTRGAYSYDNVDTPQYPTARADLGAPLTDSAGEPRVLFAGEATNTKHFATVHGAVDSGRREANRILSKK